MRIMTFLTSIAVSTLEIEADHIGPCLLDAGSSFRVILAPMVLIIATMEAIDVNVVAALRTERFNSIMEGTQGKDLIGRVSCKFQAVDNVGPVPLLRFIVLIGGAELEDELFDPIGVSHA